MVLVKYKTAASQKLMRGSNGTGLGSADVDIPSSYGDPKPWLVFSKL